LLALTAPHLKKFGLIDEIVPEPELWAMENEEDEASKGHFEAIAHKLRTVLISELKGLKTKTGNELVRGRFDKFRKMGEFNETTKKATGVS